jgi:anti-sigma factor RsiW
VDDRQDIDALLISALYGELTPADEARLSLHLESHPTDRTALADLTRARLAVRESRILERQVEPPQSISAMLLQEAARRAPRKVDSEKRSWLQRLMMSLVAHPAMAAAATLVLVVGVAGSLYMRNGDQFADKTAATAPRSSDVTRPDVVATNTADPALQAPAPGETPKGAANEIATDHASGSAAGYQVHLDDTTTAPVAKAEPSRTRVPTGNPTLAHGAASADKNLKNGIIVARKDAPTPRDFDGDKALDPVPNNDVNGFSPSTDGKLAKQQQEQRAEAAKAPATKAPPAATTPPVTGSTAQGTDRRVSDNKKSDEERKADEDLVWARAQLAQAISFKQQKNCTAAAKTIVAIQKRTPDFYNQSVAGNRDLKECQAYVDLAREKDESQKSRASKRPAPADLESTH